MSFWAERYDAAQALADAAVAEAQASANGMILPAVLAQRAWLASRRGDLTAAEADARALLDAPGPSAPRLLRNRANSVLVDVLVERGDLEEAERTLEPLAVDLPGTSQTAVLLRHARGRLRFAQRRFGEALDDLRAAGEIASGGLALSPCYLSWRSDAALAALAFGERDTALRLSDEELDLARAFGAPVPWGWRCGPLGLLTAALVVRPCCARRSKCSPAPIPASNTPAPWPTSVPFSVAATDEPRHANFSAKQSIPPTTSALKRWPYGPRPSCALPGPGRVECYLPGSKRSPPASVASPNWPPKGIQTARSPKPSSSPPGRSRATSPTCSTSWMSRPGPRSRPLSPRPRAQSAPNPDRRGPRQKTRGCDEGFARCDDGAGVFTMRCPSWKGTTARYYFMPHTDAR